jgi:hypothetical protein
MLKIYPPAQILNPWVAIGIVIFLSVNFYDTYPVLVTVLLGVIVGIHLGAWWQSAHEQWTKSIWKYYQDGSWISERARKCFAMRPEAFRHWLVTLALYCLFAAFTLMMCGLWVKFALVEFGSFAKETGLGLWLTIPASVLFGLLSTVVVIVPWLLFVNLGDNPNGYLGRGRILLRMYENIDSDELSKLTGYENERQRWILLGKSLESPQPQEERSV